MIKFLRNQKLALLIFVLSAIIFLHSYYKSEIVWKGQI